MRLISGAIVATAVLLSGPASAQSNSYVTDRPAPITGDADKIVCKKEETIGTRLGAKKVCLTVQEWRERQLADRDQTEKVQSGTRTRCEGCPEGVGKVF